jgi:hypothetical protein
VKTDSSSSMIICWNTEVYCQNPSYLCSGVCGHYTIEQDTRCGLHYCHRLSPGLLGVCDDDAPGNVIGFRDVRARPS